MLNLFRKKIASKEFSNLEGWQNFNFTLQERVKRRGISAMLRVKNEESKIEYCLNSIIELFDEIVFIDNNSTDKTVEIVQKFREQHKLGNKIKMQLYPFRVSRCGSEHNETPENSIHNLAYFYNWSMSRCSYSYYCKWDADMILLNDHIVPLKELLQNVANQDNLKAISIRGQTVYENLKGKYYLAKNEVNTELRIYPNTFNTNFRKAENFEMINLPESVERVPYKEICFYEFKSLKEDEFSHWSTRDFPSARKKLEWENYSLIKDNRISTDTFEETTDDFLKFD